MTGTDLDRLDRQLLSLLQADAKRTNAELAEAVHLSPSATLRRVQAMERAGIIHGYRATVDPKQLGLGLMAFVRVQLRQHDSAAVESFVGVLHQWPEVITALALTGDMDYLLQIAVRDLDHFSNFLLDHLLNNSAIADVNTSFVLRTVKSFEGYAAADPK